MAKQEPAAEWVDPKTLLPWAQNPRRNEKAVAKVAESIRVFGFGAPIVARRQNREIIAGHTRIEAAKLLGLKLVPVRFLDLAAEDAHKLSLADNKLGEIAEWDIPALKSLFESMRPEDVQFAGWSDEDLKGFGIGDGETKTEEDDVPEPPKTPITKPGDMWILGEHRLLCGDSTKAEDVDRLMAGERALLMNTDPPYGVSYANDDRPNPGVAKPRVANDELTGENLQPFLESCFLAAADIALYENAAWYLWHAHLTQGFFAAAAAAAAADVLLHRQIIWVKPVLLLGRGQYHWKHEPCFMGWRKGNRPSDFGAGNGERNQTTVWEIGTVTQKERRDFDHATPKPVALFSVPIVKHTKQREVCYEPFAGSGPQFIAAEQLNRRCYGLEISPHYCDVIVERWQNLTGKKAERKR